MKIWSSMKQGASKLAFEADRVMRIKKEESAIDDARKQIAAATADIGQVALDLFRNGALNAPEIAELVARIDEFETTIQQHEDTIVSIRAEVAPVSEDGKPAEAPEYRPPQEPLQPMAPPSAESPEPSAPVEPQVAAPTAEEAPTARKCPTCDADVPATGSFCTECGARLG